MQDLLSGLNHQQQQAVQHGQGPLLILAGAGSGKTKVLTHRIAYLLKLGVDPRNILAITFTNKAADEMRQRVENIAGTAAIDGIWLGTFHAVCGRILRTEISQIGYQPNFVIYDSSDQLRLIRRALKELNLDEKVYNPRGLQTLISRSKNELIDPDQVESYWLRHGSKDYNGYFLAQLSEVYRLYQQWLQENNALDFDDLLRLTVKILNQYPDTLSKWQGKFKHILVDEYQDTNKVQYLLIRLLAQKHKNLFVVGDDGQSIYGFRGASIRNILEFERDFPSACVIKLEQNYRSTQMILNAANHLLAFNREQKQKRLWTSNDQGDRLYLFEAESGTTEAMFVVRELAHLVSEGYSLRDCAVLYRTNAQSRLLEEALLSSGIKYQLIGGIRFYERMEIKDTLAFLRLLENPYDALSLERVVNIPRRGVGPRTLDRIIDFAKNESIDFITACTRAEHIPNVQRKTAQGLVQFGHTMWRLNELAAELPLTEFIHHVWADTGYMSYLQQEDATQAEGRLENLDEFQGLVADFVRTSADKTLASFLAAVSLYTDQDSYDTKTEAVTLMTLHSAKGLEFPVVFLVGLEEGLFPHSRSLGTAQELEEERRLCYVGLTRAQKKLYLTYAHSRYLFGSSQSYPRSQFIDQIPAQYIVKISGPGQNKDVAVEPAPVIDQNKVIPFPGPKTQFKPDANAGTSWQAGDRLEHPKFGLGVVVSMQGTDRDGIITVAFPAAGVKKLALRYAPIKKL